jgi:signal transduction histidine kinase
MAKAGDREISAIRRLRSALRPRLRTILIGLNLAVLILPLGSIFFFRIYENQLVQETERELIAQAAFIAAIYASEIDRLTGDRSYGRRFERKVDSKPGRSAKGASGAQADEYYVPIDPQLDLAAVDILPPRPSGYYLRTPPDPLASAAGARLTPILKEAQRTTLSAMRVLDFNGIVVAGSGEIGKSFIHVTEVQRALNGRYASVVRERHIDQVAPPVASISRGTGIRVFIVLPVVSGDRMLGFVYLSRTPKSILKHMHAEREKIIFAGLTIVALSILLAFLTSSRIVRPINQLIDQTRRMAAGDRAAIEPLERPGTREMTQLSQSFTQMASALQERSDYIRDFAAHVSHEFKTPLASIAGAVELLRDHGADMSDAERDRFLDNITQDSERLRRLVTRLLELARVDNLEPSSETLDLAGALNVMKSGFSGPAFKVEVDAPGAVRAAMSREGFETIVSNMADNARQHGASMMRVSARNGDDAVELRFADDGEGISASNREKIFTPFFTTRREDGGTGLGLGIVSSILDAHGGSIELGERDRGTEFVVRLKKAA